MRPLPLSILLALLFMFSSCDILQQAGSANKPLTEGEVSNGLREALDIGSGNAASTASRKGGFFNNPAIKILMPPEAQRVENTLRNIGLNKPVDDFILSMNEAAEEASKEAAPILKNAVRGITINDAFNILRGGNDAATRYLYDRTNVQLNTAFKPVVNNAMRKVDVGRYWSAVTSAYNKIPGVTRVEPDLESYITGKAIDGLFKLIGEEELKIRRDPVARITPLLRRVFT
ncbi:MAG: DUF4197 domain-containing protein [Flavobacteriales bacterium]